MVKYVVRHRFDGFFDFSELPEIRTVEGFSAVFIFGCCKEVPCSQKKLATGIAIKRKGRPPKDCVVTEQDKVAELKYIIARKDAKIKSLEMENELMRDFLSLTERK